MVSDWPRLGAHVDGALAAAIDAERDRIAGRLRRAAALSPKVRAELGRQLGMLELIGVAARQWAADGSVAGTAELSTAELGARSEGHGWVTVAVAAERLGCSAEYVRRLARGSRLSGRQIRPGGPWLLDAGDVAMFGRV